MENSTDRGAWQATGHRVTKSQDTTEQLTLSLSDGRHAQGKAAGEGYRTSMSSPGTSSSQCHDVVTSLKALGILLYGGFVEVSLHRHRSLPTSRGNPKHRGFYYCLILPPLLGKEHAIQPPLADLFLPSLIGTSLVAQLVKNPAAVWETWVLSLGWEDPLEKGMATPCSILA